MMKGAYKMILEIYQVGKLPPLTLVECDNWEAKINDIFPTLQIIKNNRIVAVFSLNNIAGFKKAGD